MEDITTKEKNSNFIAIGERNFRNCVKAGQTSENNKKEIWQNNNKKN